MAIRSSGVRAIRRRRCSAAASGAVSPACPWAHGFKASKFTRDTQRGCPAGDVRPIEIRDRCDQSGGVAQLQLGPAFASPYQLRQQQVLRCDKPDIDAAEREPAPSLELDLAVFQVFPDDEIDLVRRFEMNQIDEPTSCDRPLDRTLVAVEIRGEGRNEPLDSLVLEFHDEIDIPRHLEVARSSPARVTRSPCTGRQPGRVRDVTMRRTSRRSGISVSTGPECTTTASTPPVPVIAARLAERNLVGGWLKRATLR